MKRKNVILTLLLSLCLLLTAAACGRTGDTVSGQAGTASSSEASPAAVTPASEAPSPTASPAAPEEETSPAPGAADEASPSPSKSGAQTAAAEADTELPVNVMVLNGATGFGMAKLINDAAGGGSRLNYSVSVESDASNVTAALISGGVDLAVLPTNAAANVYNKTGGGIKAVAEVVRGNLYIVQNTENEAVASFEDLRGKTVYAPAQNPTFITTLLCSAMGLAPGSDVIIDNSYAQPVDLRTALAAGEVDLAVLPEPMVTIALSANDKLAVALDLRQIWQDAVGSDSLVMGCVVARTVWAEEHSAELQVFLEEYAASVSFMEDGANAESAGQLIADAGVFGQAKVAEKALPRCSLCFVTGEQMRGEIGEYLQKLFDLNPNSVGGALPGDDFYYIP